MMELVDVETYSYLLKLGNGMIIAINKNVILVKNIINNF